MTKSTVTVYKTITGRWAFVNDKTGRASNGHWATKRQAVQVARQNGLKVQP